MHGHIEQVNEIELQPGGSGIAVTERNRKEYVELVFQFINR